MSLSVTVAESLNTKPRVVVIGVGGGGGNAVNNMIRSGLTGVTFVACNTDAQALENSDADIKIQLGIKITQGLGAGACPEVGCKAAQDSIEEIISVISDAHMIFIAAGMGGGTGTGASPVIAKKAKEMGILTTAVVTKPFNFEGKPRSRAAEYGLTNLIEVTDTMIVIPNQNLFRIVSENTTFCEAFSMADSVLTSGVRGITDLMVNPGIINLDFADVRSIMEGQGYAIIGCGESESDRPFRAEEAAHLALTNPLIEDLPLHTAKGVLLNITGGDDLTLHEIDLVANVIRSEVDEEANILLGSSFDGSMNGSIKVSMVAAGLCNTYTSDELSVGTLNKDNTLVSDNERKDLESVKTHSLHKNDQEEKNHNSSESKRDMKSKSDISDLFNTLEDIGVPTFFRKSNKK